MKKIIAAILVLFLFLPTATLAAADARDIGQEDILAAELKELGLFLGVGEQPDGSTDFDLARAPSRLESLVMLVRALGKGATAEAQKKTHPFTDVPAWADGYVSYAYEAGLTKGVSDTRFGAQETASAQMYLTFMLRALGYEEGEYKDFTWDQPWPLAAWCGILPPVVDVEQFLRADVVNVTCAALYAPIKNAGLTLQERLIQNGAFTKETFDNVFPTDPFAEYRRMEKMISSYLATRLDLDLKPNKFAFEFHIITHTEKAADGLKVWLFVFRADAELLREGKIGSHGTSSSPWMLTLEEETLKVLSGISVNDVEGAAQEELVSHESFARYQGFPYDGSVELCEMVTQMKLDAGVIAFVPPTYEEVMAEIKRGFDSREVSQIIEAEPCTIVLSTHGGTPHGSYANLCLVYKPNAAMGEGLIIRLPMPSESYFSNTSEPKELWLSEDGKTLHYTYHYDDRLVISPGEEYEWVAHEAGTYRYSVDLATGKVVLDILAP
jgi:hypothetical protein